MTVKELKEAIKDLPDDMPIKSGGTAPGEYDYIEGYNVQVEVSNGELAIFHED